MHVRRLIHKLFKPVIERPANGVLRPGQGAELRSNRHPVQGHAVDTKDGQRSLQAETQQWIASDLIPRLPNQSRRFIHVGVVGELH